MHYYPHHIGDYLSHTSNLTLLEHGVYLRLLQCYYMQECPLTGDINRQIAARSDDEKEAVSYILKTFFTQTDSGYIQAGADKRIAAFREKSDKARKAVESRWHSERITNESEKHTDVSKTDTDAIPTNNHKPITNNQDNKTLTSSDDDSPVKIDYQGIVDLYNRILPELPAVKTITQKRRSAMKTCATTKPRYSGLDFWEAYFTAIRKSDFLMGRKKDWKADFDFIVRHSQFIKIIEGGHHQ